MNTAAIILRKNFPSIAGEAFQYQPNKTEKAESVLKIGPVYFKGKSPFNTKVIVVTSITTATRENKDQFITYVGFKKDHDDEFDFDEMIPNENWEDANKTHEKTCAFFSHSSLFTKEG